MKESYLHLIWKLRRIPFDLKLVDGRPIRINQPGEFNAYASGPDFFNGSVTIENLTWNGNIEIHLNSSDWFKHKHHLDEAYNNVVLHVVLKYDQEVYVKGELLPTLELGKYIDDEHLIKLKSVDYKTSWIPCSASLREVNSMLVLDQIQSSYYQRLERKTKLLNDKIEFQKLSLEQVCFETFAQAFGLKINQLPFLELSKKLPIKVLLKENEQNRLAILFGVAGFMNQLERFNLKSLYSNWMFLKQKYDLSEIAFETWKFAGVRPVNSPKKMIERFATFLSFPIFFHLHDLSSYSELENLLEALPFSKTFKTSFFVNAIIPLLWLNYMRFGDTKFRDFAMDLIESLHPESNSILDKWKEFGIPIKSSLDSQGLLELKNELCDRKKCLSCKIGNTILAS